MDGNCAGIRQRLLSAKSGRSHATASGQKQTVDSVLVSPDSECLQHATAYLKAILAYCQCRTSPYAPSLIFREHHGTRVCKLFRRPVANSLRIVRDSSSILTENPMTTPIRRAASLRPGQFKHLIRVASVNGRLPEHEVMLLWLKHTIGIRVTELALLKVADVLYPSGAIKSKVYLRADITKGCRPRNVYLTHARCLALGRLDRGSLATPVGPVRR